MFGATVANPLALAPALCMGTKDTEAFIQLVGTMFVMAGIATLLQTTIGSRSIFNISTYELILYHVDATMFV